MSWRSSTSASRPTRLRCKRCAQGPPLPSPLTGWIRRRRCGEPARHGQGLAESGCSAAHIFGCERRDVQPFDTGEGGWPPHPPVEVTSPEQTPALPLPPADDQSAGCFLDDAAEIGAGGPEAV